MNAPIQSEQVDETCGSGRVVLYLESPDMAVTKETEQDTEGVDKKKTHVTYEGVAVPEIHFKSKE